MLLSFLSGQLGTATSTTNPDGLLKPQREHVQNTWSVDEGRARAAMILLLGVRRIWIPAESLARVPSNSGDVSPF